MVVKRAEIRLKGEDWVVKQPEMCLQAGDWVEETWAPKSFNTVYENLFPSLSTLLFDFNDLIKIYVCFGMI